MSRASKWSSFFENDDSQSKWRQFLGFAIMLGGLGILLRVDLTHRAELAAAIILSGASLFAGILVGFLFGIPKTARRKTEPSSSLTLMEGDYQPNTNLEEISDWLTKMLLGIGLIELKRLPEFLDSIARYWASSLGHSSSQPYTAGLVVYFAVIGFMLGYLWTRLALVGDFIKNDPRRIISDLLQRVAAATERDPTATERSPERQVFTPEQVDAAQELQAVAKAPRVITEVLRQQIRDLSSIYDSIRATMTRGPERTHRMEVVASQMRALSLAAYPLLGELARSTLPGERLAAVTFLQTQPKREFFRWLAERMTEEEPFIGYHAAVALLNAARSATQEDRELLFSVIGGALRRTSELEDSTDRRTVLLAAQDALKQ